MLKAFKKGAREKDFSKALLSHKLSHGVSIKNASGTSSRYITTVAFLPPHIATLTPSHASHTLAPSSPSPSTLLTPPRPHAPRDCAPPFTTSHHSIATSHNSIATSHRRDLLALYASHATALPRPPRHLSQSRALALSRPPHPPHTTFRTLAPLYRNLHHYIATSHPPHVLCALLAPSHHLSRPPRALTPPPFAPSRLHALTPPRSRATARPLHPPRTSTPSRPRAFEKCVFALARDIDPSPFCLDNRNKMV